MNFEHIDFSSYIGRNALNVKSDLELFYTNYQLVLISVNSDIIDDYMLNRIRITHDNNYEVLSISIG